MSAAVLSEIGADTPLRYAMPPSEVRVAGKGRVLELLWHDRSPQRLEATCLRTLCRCAECKSARRNAQCRAVDPDIVITDVRPCGAGALNLHFSDGHRRGIFPFAWLACLGDDATAIASAP